MKYDVRAVLEGLGYTIPENAVYEHMVVWRAWYQGHYAKFHDYLQYNGRKKIKRHRKSLRMGKKVCEDHANLLMNEKVQLAIDNKTVQEKVDAAMLANDFRVQANKLVEVSYALGMGALVEHDDGTGGVLMDFVRGDMIYPLNWDGDTIQDCAFASIKTFCNRQFIYLNIHELKDGQYVITNKLIPLDATGNALMQALPVMKDATPGTATKAAPQEEPVDPETELLFGDMALEYDTNSLTPRFQFFMPNQANNIDLGSPMGISVYANSLDLLEGVDLIYDSYCNEFRLGKKRIIVPQSMLQMMQQDDETWMAFDDNDTEFYGLKMDDAKQELKEINMELRITDHDQGLQRFLNLLSSKTGLGNDRYSFEAGNVKTATEVISAKSELFQNLKKNEQVLDTALKGMCKAIAEISGITDTFETTINFDDSIIEDTDAKRTRMQALVTQGKFPLWRYLHEYEGYEEKEAKEIVAENDALMVPPPLDFPMDVIPGGPAPAGNPAAPADVTAPAKPPAAGDTTPPAFGKATISKATISKPAT